MTKSLLYALILTLQWACYSEPSVENAEMRQAKLKDTVEVIVPGLESASAFEAEYRNTYRLVDSISYESKGLNMKLYKIGSWYVADRYVPDWGDSRDIHLIEINTERSLYRIFNGNGDVGWIRGYYSEHFFPTIEGLEVRKYDYFYEILLDDSQSVLVFTSYIYPSDRIPSRTLLLHLWQGNMSLLFHKNETIISFEVSSKGGSSKDLIVRTSERFPEDLGDSDLKIYRLSDGVFKEES